MKNVAIGYKNPLYLTRAKQVQPALYNGHEIIKTHHVPAIVHDSEDTLEIAETTRKKMNEKMKDPMCVKKKVKIIPPEYSKENYLATFTPQKQLTPEQIFWSDDILKEKAKALKERANDPKPITTMTVFSELHAYTVEQAGCLELEAELSKLKDKIKKDDHSSDSRKMKCVTVDSVKPKVLAPSMYAYVEPIPARNRNNREVHLDYLKHLKESVETLCEIVEEARVEKPLDSSLASACLYTKRSQELLEYVIDTCPKDFNKRDKKIATTPLTRRNHVTFKETCETSNVNTQTHVKPQEEQKTNVPMIPSTGVTSSTEASESKPKSNTKNNRIFPAKNVNKKKVEDHPRNNKHVINA
ncbi:hypothetical protein Tco_0866180 [Tanacetum coccineum]